MFHYFKLSLLLPAALILSISTNIHAAKPAQEQTATSAALFHTDFYCTLVNVSDHEYEATITVYPFNTYPPLPHDPEVTVGIVPSGGYLIGGIGLDVVDFAYCEIKWVGQPGGIRASFCNSVHCLEVR